MTPKRIAEIRDKLADEYWDYFAQQNGTAQVKSIYIKGFDASSEIHMKVIRDLMGALETIRNVELTSGYPVKPLILIIDEQIAQAREGLGVGDEG